MSKLAANSLKATLREHHPDHHFIYSCDKIWISSAFVSTTTSIIQLIATLREHNNNKCLFAAMTELIVPRGDTFPRSFLDSYRSSRASEQLCYDLKSSRSDELVLQTPVDMPPVAKEMQHGHSENLLDERGAGDGEADSFDRCEIVLPRSRRKRVSVYDRVDPEDSIRDIVTENDFYR